MSRIFKNLCLILVICLHNNIHAQFFKNIWYEKNQLERTDFDEQLLNYKTWSIHYQRVMYAPAYVHKLSGVYDIDTKPMPGTNFGIHFTIHREKRISYYFGLDLDNLPYSYFYYNIPTYDMQFNTKSYGKDYIEDVNITQALSIPFGVDYKFASKHHANNLFFDISSDLRFHILHPGEFSESILYPNWTPIYISNGFSRKINILSPTIDISAAGNWMSPLGILSLKLTLQKGIVPYFWGTYQFVNLLHSPDTKGIYNVRADSIGLDVAFTPKKFHPKY